MAENPQNTPFFGLGSKGTKGQTAIDNIGKYGIKAPMPAKTTRFFHDQERNWLLIDAKDQILGRLATRIAKILQGKNKPTYSPNFLSGDKVVVVNASQIKVSANKLNTKVYDKYSGYPSGRKEINLKTLMAKKPAQALQLAVKGMLPKNNLGRMMYKSLKVYPGDSHKHTAQKPKSIKV